LALGDNHAELAKKLLAGDVAIAMLGPIPYAQARQKGPIRPLLITLNPEGETHYHAVIITANPAVRSLADLPGKPFAYFPRSTAAHYLPFAMLAEEGVILPDKDLVPFTSQDRMVSALLSNEAAAGGIKDALFRKLNDPRLRVLKTSRPLPQFTFAASPSLPPQVVASFTTVLLDLQPHVKESHREVVKGWDVEIAHGFSLPGKEFDQETEALLRSVAPFAKEP
jgi:phosphonate transport system substrate-binding protein